MIKRFKNQMSYVNAIVFKMGRFMETTEATNVNQEEENIDNF